MTLPETPPKAETSRGTAPYGSQGHQDTCEHCQQPFTRRVYTGPNRQRFCSDECRYAYHAARGDSPEQDGLYVGKVFHISIRNANIRAKSVRGGWKYELVAEMTADDFDLFNGHDLTGSCFEAQIECTEVAQLPLIEPEKQKGGPLSQEAAKKCREQKFCEYADAVSEEEAREFILEKCQIQSRAELDHNPIAAARFKGLMREFSEWAGARF